MDEFIPKQVTTDANLALIIEEEEEEEEEEVIDLNLRNRKKNTESKIIEVITPVEKKNIAASGYVVHASQTEIESLEYFVNLAAFENSVRERVCNSFIRLIKLLLIFTSLFSESRNMQYSIQPSFYNSAHTG